MAPDKEAAKRRRQARNRQERASRQKRIEGARRSEAARPARTADEVPSRARARSSRDSSSRTSSTAAGGGLLGKLFPPRPDAPARSGGGRPSRAQPVRSTVVEVDDASGPRGALLRLMAQPGGRATLMAVFFAIAAGVALLVLPIVPVAPAGAVEHYGRTVVRASTDDAGDRRDLLDDYDGADPVSGETVTLLDAAGPAVAALFALVPILIAAVAVRSLTKPTRSRTLLISAGAAALFSFLGGGGIFTLPSVMALGFAAYRSRKADARAAAAVTADA